MISVELINTGSELLLGATLNTHAQWLARRLSDSGYTVVRQTSIPDTAKAIEEALREALSRVDVVVMTGGLGPTSDDLTRDRVAAMLGLRLLEDAETVRRIEAFFAQRQKPMPARTRVQAMAPEGAEILLNDFGTAPGLAFELVAHPLGSGRSRSFLALLPGPPRELRPMFDRYLMPWLQRRAPLATEWACRTLRTVGLGESMAEEIIEGPLQGLVELGLRIGYCAHVGQVDVRFSREGEGSQQLVEEASRKAGKLLKEWIFGEGTESLEGGVLEALRASGNKLAISESCTGGLLTHRLTNIPGASDVVIAGVVSYANAAKSAILGVPEELIEAHGAVSREVAASMAEGVRHRLGADYGLSITGIAGPGGGTDGKPVGTVFLAIAWQSGTRVIKRFNPYDRLTFKEVTSSQALDLLRRELANIGRDEPSS